MKKLILPFLIILLCVAGVFRAGILSMLPASWLMTISHASLLDRSDKNILAADLYHQGEISRAQSLWESVSSSGIKDIFSRDAYFNLGNLAYESAGEQKMIDDQIIRLLEAKTDYEKSLEIEHTPDAKANLEVVIKLLEQLQKKQEEEKKSEPQNTSSEDAPEQSSGSGSSQDSTGKSEPSQQWTGSWSQTPDTNSWSQTGTWETGTWSDLSKDSKKGGFTNQWQTQGLGRDFGTSTWASLTPSERAQLDDTLARIRDLQQRRGEYTRPDGTKTPDQWQWLFEQFLRNDPLFQDIQNGGTQKRDW